MTHQELKRLYAKRQEVWQKAKDLHDDVDGSWSAEDDATWQRLNARLDRCDKEIDRGERKLRERSLDAISNDEHDRLRRGKADPYTRAFESYVRRGARGMEPGDLQTLHSGHNRISRVMQTTSGAGGGFAIPEGFWDRVTERMKSYMGPFMERAFVLNTETGNDMPWVFNDDTTNEGERLAEGAKVTKQDLVFSQSTLKAHVYSSKEILVSFQLLQDEGVDILGLLERSLAKRIGRITMKEMTLGDGSDKPEGILYDPTLTYEVETFLTTHPQRLENEMINIQNELDPEYEQSGDAFWMFSKSVLTAIRKLKDDDERFLWLPSLSAGAPSTVFGDPYVLNQNMSPFEAADNATDTSKKSFWWGDMNAGYVVRNVRDFTLMRLDELYAESLQVAFFGYSRMDALPNDKNAYVVGHTGFTS